MNKVVVVSIRVQSPSISVSTNGHCLNVHAWFAEVCFDEIFKTLLFKIGGMPPPDATSFRRYVVAMTVNRDKHYLSSLIDLSVLPNGDWRNVHAVEVYVPAGSSITDELRTFISKRCTRALVAHTFGIISQDSQLCVCVFLDDTNAMVGDTCCCYLASTSGGACSAFLSMRWGLVLALGGLTCVVRIV